MRKKTGYISFVLTLAAFLIPALRAQAGEWLVSIKSSGNGCVTEYCVNGDTETIPFDWYNLDVPPFLDGLASLEMDEYTAATATLTETFTITLTWVDANGAPPPTPLRYLISGRSSWAGLPQINLFHPSALHIGGSCYTDDGLGDPYIGELVSTNGADGASQGTHLFKVDNPGTTVTKTVTMTIDCSWPATNFDYYTNFGNGIGVCLLTDLNPFPPDELWDSDPVLLYHGTSRGFADQIVNGLPLQAVGTGDFGLGFYTLGTSTGSNDGLTGSQYAQKMALRAVRNSPNKDWGVIRFEVPLTDMLDFFCTYQDYILGYGYAIPDTDRLNGVPPWNAPSYFANNPPDNLAQPIPEGPMNWYNFSWYNWYLKRCIYGAQAEDDEGLDNYVPLWDGSDPANNADWHYSLTWGRFFMPPKWYEGCDPFQLGFGPLQSGHIQHTWGSRGGLGLLNQTDVVKRYLDSYGTASSGWAMAISPEQVVGGNTVTGTITFFGPHTDVTLSLSSDNAHASVPSSVTVPSGVDSASFVISTTTVTQSTDVHITASDNQTSHGLTLKVQPHQ